MKNILFASGKSPEKFVYYIQRRLGALTKWKLLQKKKNKQEWLVESLLFDLSNDIGEANV